MKLWIRSQDKKTLSIAKNIKLDRYLGDKENVIINNDSFEIGKYKTEERALEILDEIQNILNLKDMYKYDRESVLKSWENINEKQIKTVRQQMSVYEMPEK